MKNIFLSLSLILFLSNLSIAQNEQEKFSATSFSQANSMQVVPSIASRIKDATFIEAVDIIKEYNPKRSDGNKVVPGKGTPIDGDPLRIDPSNRTNNPSKSPIITWNAATSGSTPTDPTGAVGPNHYVNAWNSSFRIWDKEGNSLTAPASLANIFPGEDLGDPIVFYDKFANRFVITQFSDTPNGFLVAICQGPDPLNDGWYTYRFNTNSFPDYPKFSVWSDGYYITSNKNSNSATTSDVVYVINRDKMIIGDETAEMQGFSLPQITTNGFFSPLGFNCNGPELPPTGGAPIVYMQDNAWFGVSTDHLKIWTIDVDWENENNSSISNPQILNTATFKSVFDGGSFSNLPQPSGPDIDALQATIMYMAQYRRFPDHNSVVFNFVVDLGTSSDHAGIRWYELRQNNDGDNWTIYQEGTHEQPDGHSAFAGSMAMDALGNIGLAYTVVSETQSVSIRYSGRYESDPLNEMTVIEDTLEAGNSNNPNLRYGDYSQMTIDPIDDKTFWHIAEYFSGNRRNVVGAFKLAPDLTSDVGILAINSPTNATLSANEMITISVRNFGIDSIWDVPLNYSVDGGTLISEVYTDTIPPSTTVEYTFLSTSDMSTLGNNYEITAYTSLATDEDHLNDTSSTVVTHIDANDLGVASLLTPISSNDLTDSELISIKIKNYGGMAQSNFEVSYILDGAAPVTEIVEGPIGVLNTLEYTFNTPADFSAVAVHELKSYTSLDLDTDINNDTNITYVESIICTPNTLCSLGDGFELFSVSNLNNPSGCSDNGYGDYTNMTADLLQGNTYDLTVTTDHDDQYIKVWIDYNDNFLFENDEVVVDNFLMAEGAGNNGPFTETMDLTVAWNANIGEHLMRAKANRDNEVPENACEETNRGETEDYTADIAFFNDINESKAEKNDMIINYLPDNHFEVTFTDLNSTETLRISVHNSLGQQVIYNLVRSENGHYFYDFDMSYAAPGVYLVRLGSDKMGKVKKIVVK
jgi:hypothetical protein